jgi:hypothetical protein
LGLPNDVTLWIFIIFSHGKHHGGDKLTDLILVNDFLDFLNGRRNKPLGNPTIVKVLIVHENLVAMPQLPKSVFQWMRGLIPNRHRITPQDRYR